jgi:ATP-dependent Clp protease ATP-binding subunit ClpA
MSSKYTPNADKVLKLAAAAAKDMKQNYIGTEHLLAGLVKEEDGVASRVLQENGLGKERIDDLIRQLNVEGGNVTLLDRYGYSPRCAHVLQIAGEQAARYNSVLVGTEHLMLALILEGDNVGVKLLESVGINPSKSILKYWRPSAKIRRRTAMTWQTLRTGSRAGKTECWRSTAAILPLLPRPANWIRSSAGRRRSAGWCRSFPAAPRTIPA